MSFLKRKHVVTLELLLIVHVGTSYIGVFRCCHLELKRLGIVLNHVSVSGADALRALTIYKFKRKLWKQLNKIHNFSQWKFVSFYLSYIKNHMSITRNLSCCHSRGSCCHRRGSCCHNRGFVLFIFGCIIRWNQCIICHWLVLIFNNTCSCETNWSLILKFKC